MNKEFKKVVDEMQVKLSTLTVTGIEQIIPIVFFTDKNKVVRSLEYKGKVIWKRLIIKHE